MAKASLRIEDLNISKPQTSKDRIESAAIVGGGVMGRGIAQTIASAGIDVLIVELSKEILEESKNILEEGIDREIQRWAMTKGEKKSILSRIKYSVDINEIKNYNLIIEAVDEKFELKESIFKQIDSICHPETIIVSNTATLSLTEIAKFAKRSDKVIGMHFLNPVPKIPLVEVVRALKTSDETFKKVKEFGEKIGKTVVETYEYPGFVTTRIIVPLLNEAMYVLMEGIATADGIDTAMKLGYNLPMGPLELADSMGLDEVFNWMESLRLTLGDIKYRPCPILRRLVREGKLGKKSGEGFFKYDGNGKKTSTK
jgi:3-hydroxybutyryl-CoA dehydrogenase